MQKLVMNPPAGERLLRFVGDRLGFTLRLADGQSPEDGWRVFLRTSLGRAKTLRRAIIHAHTGKVGLATSPWRDIPMRWENGQWRVDLALTEVGFFKAKPYVVDRGGWQHWPDGPDVGVSVHPDAYRTANTIYCAFTRMFGASRTAVSTQDDTQEKVLRALEQKGYAVLPPSGKFRDLIRHLPHIMGTLGCRILHLLPVHPTPTTYARFGRFGSPYACQDLLAVDPALVEFDRRTTGVEQFQELTWAAHLNGGRVFLDVVINHTGWGSPLQETHPEWFVREEDGTFVSPGAWGTTWEDLVELQHQNPTLWEYMAEVFLEWCRRGVDGFRCDAGYKIPVPAWQYITARVQEEFPDTLFFLEGLGGSWAATEQLLTEGGMQWAYSELFQNHSGSDVAGYLDYALQQSRRVGLYVHYSETHDNERLAKKGRAWSLLRNHLCALTSVSGAFGFTGGVEWLAKEKIEVHQSRGLAWENENHIIPQLSRLNRLLAEHPCFFDHATLTRLSEPASPVFALHRVSAEGPDQVLVLINTDPAQAHELALDEKTFRSLGSPTLDLVSGKQNPAPKPDTGLVRFQLEPGACWCLAETEHPRGLSGEKYRRLRAEAAWALSALAQVWPCETIGPCDWRELARLAATQPTRFLSALKHLDPARVSTDLLGTLGDNLARDHFPNVVTWQMAEARRCTLVPPEHWLLVQDDVPFRVALGNGERTRHAASVPLDGRHLVSFPPGSPAGQADLVLERYHPEARPVRASLRFLGATPQVALLEPAPDSFTDQLPAAVRSGLVLLTNGRGGMSRMRVDLGRVQSKYDCVLGANLHPTVPCDRHVFVKRVRLWVNADGFITALDGSNLVRFAPGPPAEWRFVAGAGDGRAVEIQLLADMLPDKNTTVLRLRRPDKPMVLGAHLPEACHVSLTVRVDILDRGFHSEMHFSPGTEHHFQSHTQPLPSATGFEFTPAHDRHLRVWTDAGAYHVQPEWSMAVEHPVERSRGQADLEDTYSPGWFEIPMDRGGQAHILLTSESERVPENTLATFEQVRQALQTNTLARANLDPADHFGRSLARAIPAYVVRREEAKTIIAGYPWFLDWGRDSLICARGLLAAGLHDEARQLLVAFGRLTEHGTLPNSIHGQDTSNRDTSDAPLWYALVAEELARHEGPAFYETQVDPRGRTIGHVLVDIATSYCHGTPNGIRMDPESRLIWSPSHFTWMDTNYPACTPREGYPVEIQALWIRLCRQLAREGYPAQHEPWQSVADHALASLEELFWLENRGYVADLLIAKAGQTAREAVADTALRSNYLLAISLGLFTGPNARRAVEAARRFLLVPGGVRSLAPLPVTPPLPIRAPGGELLNNPTEPYLGSYEGDEDTRRKPAYHNGTAWIWTLPAFCEAMARAWDFAPAAVNAAAAYLGSLDRCLTEGCLGHLPEILDGDAPHAQRGCDAQAWSTTETLRVWKLLQTQRPTLNA